MFLLPLGDNVNHRKLPVGSIGLIVVNVVVYSQMSQIGSSDHGRHLLDFVHAWALTPVDFHKGDWVGLVTHMFLHGSWMHVIGNMFFLWAFAISLEAGLGTLPFLSLYFVMGLAGGMLHLIANPDSKLPMLGASGAIAGVMGAYFVAFGAYTKIRTLVCFFIRISIVNIPALAFLVVWLLLQFAGAASHNVQLHGHEQGGVAWFAHLGGFGTGVISMFLLRNHTQARLAVNRHGALLLVEKPDPNAVAAQKAAPAAPAAPPAPALPPLCPYCHTPLGERDQLAPTLLRCPNPACARCIYLEQPLAAPKARVEPVTML